MEADEAVSIGEGPLRHRSGRKQFGAMIWLEWPGRPPLNLEREAWSQWYRTARDRDAAVAAINRRPSTDRGSAYRAAPLSTPPPVPTAPEPEASP